MFDLAEERHELGRSIRQLLVEPGSCRIGRQRQLIRQVHAGVELRFVGTAVEAEDLRQQDHAVQLYRLLLQLPRDGSRTRSAVALSEQILRRIPAAVLAEKLGNETGKGLGVAIDPVEGFFLVLAARLAE